MKIKNISEHKMLKLPKYTIPDSILNTESEIFIFDGKEKWDKSKKIFKKLYVTEGELFSNKLYIINEEINKAKDIGMEELILPEQLVSIKGIVSGFTMPYIDNINLKVLLNSGEFSVSDKINYLKEIGIILEKMKNLREYKSVSNFYLNDVHINNFILNKQTSSINVVDMDSARIGNSLTMPSRYLNSHSNINYVNKYNKVSNSIGGVFEADYNTDLYCYIMIILEFIFGDGIDKLSMEEYYLYMQYLCDIGVSKELVDYLALIYMETDNENPYHLLDYFTETYGKSSKYAFNYVRKK